MSSKKDRYLKRIRATLKNSGYYSIKTSDEIEKEFTKRYGHLKKYGLQVTGIANLIADHNVLSVSIPFIFDHRMLPKSFMGLDIRISVNKLPKEFQNLKEEEYIWAYQRYEQYVDRHGDKIRKNLNKPEMNREEMLDALCNGDFKKHKENCLAREASGKIPKWKK